MKTIRVALIGAGQIARTTHIPCLQRQEGVEIAAVCDVNREAAESLAADFGLPAWYESHEKMLEQERPDAVIICVPNRFHCAMTLDALRAGCHVLCEKPPAMTVEEAERMEALASEKNRLLTYGFHFRHMPQVRILKEMAAAGELGTIYHTEVRWTRRRGIPGWGSFTNKAMQGGGPLIDIGAHMLDTALYLLDYPEIAWAAASSSGRIGKQGGCGRMGRWSGERFTVEDGLFGTIHFADGSDLQLATSFALNQKEENERKVLLFGDRLGASLFPPEIYGEKDGLPFMTAFGLPEGHDWHEDSDRNFVKACRGEEPLLVTAASGTYLQKVIGMLYRSVEEGEPVKC